MKKRYDVIALGVAVMDIIASPADKSIFEREKTVIETLMFSPGGDAVNQSIDLSKLGLNVSLCCRVGKDGLGKQILDTVKEKGADVSHSVISSSDTTAAIVLVSPSGQRNIMFKKGGNNYDFCVGDIDMEYIAQAKALSVASIFGVPKLEEDGLADILKHAKENGLKTFADMGSDKKGLKLKGVSPFLPFIDYFLPSEGDSQYLTGEKDCCKAADIFISEGAKNVVIKLGAKGAYARCEGFKGFIDTFDIDAKDTTGAGDAFCAGFIYGTLNGYTVKDSLEFACACGAFNSLYSGASMSPISTNVVNEFLQYTPRRKVIR